MADHREGKGQILSAEQLAERLAVPCFYLLVGRAQAAFPETCTPAPSSFVQVIRTGPLIWTADVSVFPVTVNWRQWQDVIAPLLEEGWAGYLGFFGGTISRTNFGIPNNGPGRGVFSCSPETKGLHQEMVTLIRKRLTALGEAAGYS